MEPVVVNLGEPKHRLNLPHLPGLGPRGTKILTAGAVIVMSLSMVLFVVLSALANNQNVRNKLHLPGATSSAPQNVALKSDAALPGGSIVTGTGGSNNPEAPDITLTAQPATVDLGGTARLKWSVSKNATSCTASEDWSGNKSTTSGEETTPKLTQQRSYKYILTCKNDKGTSYKKVSVGVAVKSATGNPSTRPDISFAAAPTTIFAGQKSSLAWEATNNPSSCTAGGDWSGAKASSGNEVIGPFTKVQKYTFTLTCKNTGGEQTVTTYLEVANVPAGEPLVSILSRPPSPVTQGTTVTLEWSTENAPDSCTASGDWSGQKGTSGSQSLGALNAIKTYNYTLACTKGSVMRDATATIEVVPGPPVISLSVNPMSINAGSAATISYSATNNPTSCTASGTGPNWSGAISVTGTTKTQSTGTLTTPGAYTYDLTCTNSGGTTHLSSPVTLTVNAAPKPSVSLTANPTSLTAGSSSTLNWTTGNSPSSCTASGSWGGSKNVNGGTQSTGNLAAGSYTYNLTCVNASGSTTATATVGVSAGGGGAQAPVASISVSPTTVAVGSSATISWVATNSPTSCTAGGNDSAWSGSQQSSGTKATSTFTSSGTRTYTLVCSNSAGTSNTASTTISVGAAPGLTLTANPTSTTANSNVTLTWSTTNSPTSCTASGSWSGSKSTSGATQTVTQANAGTATYTLTCTNSTGSISKSVNVTYTSSTVYCAGHTNATCYGPNDLNAHNTMANCWGYNTSSTDATNRSVYNITTFNNGWHKSRDNLLPNATTASILCGAKDFKPYVSGTSLSGVGSHNHASSTKANTNNTLNGYFMGYYDPNKP